MRLGHWLLDRVGLGSVGAEERFGWQAAGDVIRDGQDRDLAGGRLVQSEVGGGPGHQHLAAGGLPDPSVELTAA